MSGLAARYAGAAKDLAGAARQKLADRRGRGVVLCYHRVAELDDDPQMLAVAPERFRAQLELLRERYEPLPLAELVERRDDLPARSVAVTFDDGYADNLVAAAPMLEDAQMPATVFVTTGFTGAGKEFWWDELERLLLVGDPSGELVLRTNGDERRWTLEGPEQRMAAYRELHAWLRPLPTDEIEAVLVQLRQFAGEPAGGVARDTHRQLTADELVRLDASPVVEIGAHTVTHPSLGHQPEDAQRRELAGSKAALEDRLAREIRSMSYPFGSRLDQTRATRRLARDAGYALAAANFPGLVGPSCDPWQVPRVLVRDWDAAELEARLEPIVGEG